MHNSKVIRTRWSYRCSQPKLFYDNHVSVKNFFLVSSLNLPNISSDHFLSSYHLSSEKRNKHLLCCNLLSSSCRKWWGPLGPPPVRFWIITKMETLQLLSRSHCSTSLTLKCLLILKLISLFPVDPLASNSLTAYHWKAFGSRMSSPSFLSLSSYIRCSNPFSLPCSPLVNHSTMSILLFTGKSTNEPSTVFQHYLVISRSFQRMI